jgi:MoaA/NifB/PqqE/SkfB family radical SAM enzyme
VKDLEGFSRVVDELVALRNEGYGLVPDADALKGFLDYFRAGPKIDKPLDTPPVAPRRCAIGFRNVFIYPDGKVCLCDIIGSEIGNVHTSSLAQMWYSQETAAQRRRMLRCQVNCQASCTRPTPFWTKVKVFLRTG